VQAIARAGGLASRADQNKIDLTRAGRTATYYLVINIDYTFGPKKRCHQDRVATDHG
jgi:protein involved in polysaccharide export with SLBB domain